VGDRKPQVTGAGRSRLDHDLTPELLRKDLDLGRDWDVPMLVTAAAGGAAVVIPLRMETGDNFRLVSIVTCKTITLDPLKNET